MPQPSKNVHSREQMDLSECIAIAQRESKAKAEAEAEGIRRGIRRDFGESAENVIDIFEDGIEIGKRIMGYK